MRYRAVRLSASHPVRIRYIFANESHSKLRFDLNYKSNVGDGEEVRKFNEVVEIDNIFLVFPTPRHGSPRHAWVSRANDGRPHRALGR